MANYTIDDCVINITPGRETTQMTVWKWNDKRRDYDTIVDSGFSGYTLWELICKAEYLTTGRDFDEYYWADDLDIDMPDDDE